MTPFERRTRERGRATPARWIRRQSASARAGSRGPRGPPRLGSAFLTYVVAAVAVAVATAIRLSLEYTLQGAAATPLYFAAVLLASWYGGWRPALLALLLGAVASHYFVVPPRHAPTMNDPDAQTALALFLAVGLCIVWFGEAMRTARRRAEASEDDGLQREQQLHREIEERLDAERLLADRANLLAASEGRLREALRQADRRKDEFLAMLAHELRNPLAPLRNATEILRLAGATDLR